MGTGTCIEMGHPTQFRPLVDCPGSRIYGTDNVNKIGDKNYVRPTEPSREKYREYNHRDVNGKSDKGRVSKRSAVETGTHGIT